MCKVKVAQSCPTLQPMNSPGQNTGVGSLSPSPGDLPNPGVKPRSPALQMDSLPSEPPGKTNSSKKYLFCYFFFKLQGY